MANNGAWRPSRKTRVKQEKGAVCAELGRSCEDAGSAGNETEAEKNEVPVTVSTVPENNSSLWKSPGDKVNSDTLNPNEIVRSLIGSSKMAASFDRADVKDAINWHDCDRCGFKFLLEGMLNRHRVMSHSYESTGTRWISRKKVAWASVDKSTIHERPVRQNGGKLRNDEERTVLPGLLVKTEVTSEVAQPSHVCNFCEFACDDRAEHTSHLSNVHNILIFPDVTTSLRYETCDTSDDPRTRRRCRRENIPTNFQEETRVCEYCDFSCKKRSTLTSHVSRKHRRETTACTTRLVEVGEVKFDRDEKVANEERLNASKSQIVNVLSCNSCSFESPNKRTMSSHKRRQHTIKPTADEIYRCNECDFKTGKKTSLYSHIKRKHKYAKSSYEDEDYGDEEDEGSKPPSTVALFACGQCDYKNKNKYELMVHVARKHTDDYKFTCETCSKKFKVTGDLANHVRFSRREQPVICYVCGKTCLNSNSLYVHQKFAHYKAKYECHVCKRRMVSQENLDEHMLRQHEKRESVVCEECGKTFSRNSRLKIHMRIHTGDRPYECQVCNRSFARRTALKQHLLIHTGVRPYVCNVCGKAFTQKPGLISHRKSHPGPLRPLPRVRIDHILNDVIKPNL